MHVIQIQIESPNITLSQAQMDKVIDAVVEALPEQPGGAYYSVDYKDQTFDPKNNVLIKTED